MLVNFVKRVYEPVHDIKINRKWDMWKDKVDVEILIGRYRSGTLLREELICTRDLDCPPLREGEEIYDKDLGRNFYIIKSIRNTDNTYTCIVENEIEDTQASLARKYELEKEVLKSKETIGDLESEIETCKYNIKKLTENLEAERSKSIWQLIRERFV